MISDILLDVKFLSGELGVRDFSTLFVPQSIYRFKDNGTCFLGDWCRAITTQTPTTRGPTNQTETTETVLGLPAFRLGFKDIQNMGLSVIELDGIDFETMNELREMKANQSEIFEFSLEGMLNNKALSHLSENLRKL